jgi:glycosyltransferase involved in cell wall biosynthesis
MYVPLLADRLLRTRFWSWRTNLRALGAAALLPGRKLDAALADFKPEVVAALMQDSWYYEYAAAYARKRRIPLVLIIHDLPDGFEPVAPWLRNRQLRRDGRIYRQATHRLCISEPMRDHFRSAFGVDGGVLHPPRTEPPVAQSPEQCRQLKHPGHLTLGYAGGLHYGYGEQLQRMLPMLRATGTRVEYFGPTPGGANRILAEAPDVFRCNGYVSPPEAVWSEILQKCDAVLQPYSNPLGRHELQCRTHFPSKLTDYLSLGLPVLITGPAEASGTAWCLRHPGCAMTITDPSPAALTAGLRQLAADSTLRVNLARGAQIAAAEFDAGPLRTQLFDALTDAAAAH